MEEVHVNGNYKITFVNGSLPIPNEDDPCFAAWIGCNNMVISWFVNFLSTKIASTILFVENAPNIWKELHIHFAQSDHPRIFQLRKL